MAFSTTAGETNTIVAAMAISSEGIVSGAMSTNSTPGLYTSSDAGQTWTYDALSDSGGTIDAQSATSVVYNSSVGLFFAAVRYHGVYSSPDGVNWTRLASQPAGTLNWSASNSTVGCSVAYTVYEGINGAQSTQVSLVVN